MASLVELRKSLVERQIEARGVTDPAVLAAFSAVRREAFLPPEMAEFAYLDRALPIEMGQTISQPYIVALMTEALELGPNDRVLEVGTGSGYAAAILAKIAREVYTIERHGELAEQAAGRLQREGFDNVWVRHGDGTLGWPEHAPYQGIVVAAGGPEVPQPLLDQLAIGGRLVIPVGQEKTEQKLLRVTRTGPTNYTTDELGDVRFVPLVGRRGWQGGPPTEINRAKLSRTPSRPALVSELIHESAEPFSEIRSEAVAPLVDRIGDCRLALVGEATHGSSEFYRIRAEITKELIRRHRFSLVAIEADWPDAAQVDRYVRGLPSPDGHKWSPFSRFPTWMWRNHEVLEFVEWLREYNLAIDDPDERVAFYGLDLYSMFTSIRVVLDYMDRVDPESATIARLRYGCLTPWEADPALYGRMALGGRYRVCEDEAVAMLKDLLEQRLRYVQGDGARFMDAVQNARLIANAERYYRAMYYGSNASWNQRDQHMFDTLEMLLGYHGKSAKAVVWEHNSHLGDAAHTEMGAGGQINVGQLCRERFGEAAYLVGQGTDHGTVAAAANWDEPMERMLVRTAYPGSYENLFHDSRVAAFFLPLRDPHKPDLRFELATERLERAIGVVYRPDSELASHYFHARLSEQFDEFVWFDQTTAVRPISADDASRLGPDHPFSCGPTR